MSQHDFNIANQGFPSFRTDLNNALVALATTSSGTAEPATTYANQLWYETDTNILHIRNEANSAWLDLMEIDQTTGSPSFNAGDVGIADKIVHSGDTNTSIRFPTNDTVTVETGGTERLRVTSAGNVGIGTGSTVSAALHVNSGAANLAGLFESTDAGALITLIDNSTTGGSVAAQGLNTVGDELEVRAVSRLAFETAGTEQMSIGAGGVVTINGTVSAANLLSGTYTPTLTAVANVAASTAYVTQYLRVGAVVTVSGHVQLTPTAANTDTRLRMTLPIASNLGSQSVGGAGANISTGLFGEGIGITGDTTNDEADFRCRPTSTAQRTYAFSFTYRII